MATEDPRIVRIVNKAKKGDEVSFKKLLKMVEPDLKKIEHLTKGDASLVINMIEEMK